MKGKSIVTQVIIGFVLLILVDSTTFDVSFKKQQYSMMNSIINVVGYAKSVFVTAKKIL